MGTSFENVKEKYEARPYVALSLSPICQCHLDITISQVFVGFFVFSVIHGLEPLNVTPSAIITVQVIRCL